MDYVYADFQRLREYQKLDRNLWRTFHCACCRDIWSYIKDNRSRSAIESAERFTHGQGNEADLETSYIKAKIAAKNAWKIVESLRLNRVPDEWIWPVSAVCDDAWVRYSAASATATCALNAKNEILFTRLPDAAASVRPWANARIDVEKQYVTNSDEDYRQKVLERFELILREEDRRFSEILHALE